MPTAGADGPPGRSSPFRADLLAGEHVFVTGGGTGLGAAMARAFAGLGATVSICGRRRAPLQDTAGAIAAAGGHAHALPCDVRQRDKVVAALDEAERRGGPLTRLVNNAAGNFLALSEELDDKGFEAVLAINLWGTFHATQELGRRWIERGTRGAVLSIVTTYAETGSAYVLPSAASKAGVLALTRSLAAEWGRFGIRLNAIAPGPIPTPGAWSRLVPDAGLEERLREAAPLRRFATREELADLACFLLSDAAGAITGEVVALDAGARLTQGGTFNALTARPHDELKAAFAALRPRPRAAE